MGRNAEAILKQALGLSEAERATEVAARVAQLDAGEVQTVPWEEVRDRLFARLSARRGG